MLAGSVALVELAMCIFLQMISVATITSDRRGDKRDYAVLAARFGGILSGIFIGVDVRGKIGRAEPIPTSISLSFLGRQPLAPHDYSDSVVGRHPARVR